MSKLETEASLQKVENFLRSRALVLEQASEAIRDEGVSNYPLFVVHEQAMDMGVLLESSSREAAFYLSASTLEEVYVKQIVAADYVDDFRKLYKEKSEQYCVLLLFAGEARWLFVPK